MIIKGDLLRIYIKLDVKDNWYEHAKYDLREKRIEEMLRMTEEEFKAKYPCFRPNEKDWMRIHIPDFIAYRIITISPITRTINELLDLYKAFVDITKRLKEIYG